MLAIARALMTNPTLLLLDEPMEGLAPLIIEELVQVLRSLVGQTSMAFILVEQHARLALTLTDRALVLDRGAMTYLGESGSLLDDPARLDALLVVGAQ